MTRQASEKEVNALRQEQRDEVESTMVGAGNVGPFTKGMSQGMAIWIPISTVVGALIGLALAPLVLEDRSVLMVIIGAVAGAVFGFTAGGFVGSRRRGEGDARSDDPNVAPQETAPSSVRLEQDDPPVAPSSDEAKHLVRE